MANLPGGQPVLDHDKIVRAPDPRIRGDVPAEASPIQSANQTLEKVSLTLNRAGTHRGNPILAGLAGRVQIPLATLDILTGLFVFTDRADPKGNLIDQVSGGPAGLRTLDLVMVDGQISVGTPATGPRRNYIRQVSASGIFERTFWVQSKDFNTVQLNGTPALDPDTLAPVAITVTQPNVVDPFITLVADFFVAWADEFHVEHRSENLNLTPGYAKAYGGSLFVSVFDTNPTPAVEGVGVEVNPYTEVLIAQQKKVEVQNTVGLKRFTFRFRAKQGSPYFVDCPVEVNVVAVVAPVCNPPVENGGPLPPTHTDTEWIPPQEPPVQVIDIPWSDLGGGELVPYSVEGVTPIANLSPLTEPILVFTIQAQVIGANPTVLVRRWCFVAEGTAKASVDIVFDSQKEYIPFLVAGATKPTQGAPYLPAQAYRISFSDSIESLAQIVIYEISIKEGTLVSIGETFFGPGLALIASFIKQGTGVAAPTPPS